MIRNMGTVDRVIRFLIAVAIVVVYFMGKISGAAAIVLGIIAIAFFATSLMGTCPGYMPFSFSTRKREGGTTASDAS